MDLRASGLLWCGACVSGDEVLAKVVDELGQGEVAGVESISSEIYSRMLWTSIV